MYDGGLMIGLINDWIDYMSTGTIMRNIYIQRVNY